MGILSVNTNNLANTAAYYSSQQADMITKVGARLASGLRINSAYDDPAGLFIMNSFQARIEGFQQAQRNASDGISLAQTAEGYLQEIDKNILRIRVLLVQGYNGTYTNDALNAMNFEIQQRLAEIKRIGDQAEFNGISLFNNHTGTQVNFQVGALDSQQMTVGLQFITANVPDPGTAGHCTLQIGGYNSTMVSATITAGPFTAGYETIKAMDSALSAVDTLRGEFGAIQQRLQSVVNTTGITVVNLQASKSLQSDADFSIETVSFVRAKVLQESGIGLLSQALQVGQSILRLLQSL